MATIDDEIKKRYKIKKELNNNKNKKLVKIRFLFFFLSFFLPSFPCSCCTRNSSQMSTNPTGVAYSVVCVRTEFYSLNVHTGTDRSDI